MRVTIPALGTRGDVQPFVALGLGLQKAGHTVCLATHTNYAQFIKGWGLDFFPIAGNPQEILASAIGQGLLNPGYNFVQYMQGLRRIIKPLVAQVLDDLSQACQQSDVILYSLLAFAAHYIAEECHIPAVPALLQPLSRTSFFPTILGPRQKSLGGYFNFLTHVVIEQIFWQLLRSSLNKWQQKHHKSSPPFWGHFGQLYHTNTLMLHGYSPTVVPRPPDWMPSIQVTGYWFLETATTWHPPANLVDFLASGSPPICIGFGSMNTFSLEERIHLALLALNRTSQRGILLTGWGQVKDSDLPDDVFTIEAIPHDWLFPQVAAVIHHGGAGTTAAAMRAGIPEIIVPFFFDQRFWGRRIVELGIGPPPISPKMLSVETLTDSIQTIVTNQTIQERAATLGQCIRQEDGIQQAVKAFHQYLSLY